jgi:hypothetical protein
MVRTQIQFPEGELRRLRRLAREEGISISEFVRRCVAHATRSATVSRQDGYGKAAALAGAFRDREAAADLSSDHDRYLDESLG